MGIIVACHWPDCLATAEGSQQELQAAGWEIAPGDGRRAWCAEHAPPF